MGCRTTILPPSLPRSGKLLSLFGYTQLTGQREAVLNLQNKEDR